jgi:hypothetical protein
MIPRSFHGAYHCLFEVANTIQVFRLQLVVRGSCCARRPEMATMMLMLTHLMLTATSV